MFMRGYVSKYRSPLEIRRNPIFSLSESWKKSSLVSNLQAHLSTSVISCELYSHSRSSRQGRMQRYSSRIFTHSRVWRMDTLSESRHSRLRWSISLFSVSILRSVYFVSRIFMISRSLCGYSRTWHRILWWIGHIAIKIIYKLLLI